MSDNELVISSEDPGGAIEANFDALKASIERIVKDYTGLVIVESYVPQAKKDRAYLNSLSTSLNQRRKDVKARYMAPVVAFEAKVAELDAPIKAASAAIDEQVKAFEVAEREAKREELVKHYTDYAGVLVDVVPFERIEQPGWLNKTCNLMTAFSDIEERVERIAKDEATLTELDLTHPVDAKTEYFATLDLSRAIARSRDLDAQEARTRALDEQKAAIAAEREAAAKVEPEPVEPEPAVIEPVIVEEPRTYTFTVKCSPAERDVIASTFKAMGLSGTIREM